MLLEGTLPRVYRLSYAPGNRRNKKAPTLVFIVLTEYVEAAGESLVKKVSYLPAREYLREDQLSVWTGAFGQRDLFDASTFGYGRCGIIRTLEEETEFRFPLRAEHLYETAFSVFALTSALRSVLYQSDREGRVSSNRTQLIDLHVSCRPGEFVYAHPVSGYVLPHMRAWLGKLGERCAQGSSTGSLPASVQAALRDTWRALTGKKPDEYSCSAVISRSGRFHLCCPGNACDLSIYPDGDDPEGLTEFSCHNLDTASQQLTLLAGLGALLDLSVEELGP